MPWRSFFQQNIDKVLLILVFHGIMVMIVTNMTNATLVDWLRGEAGTVLGALLMLITGRNMKAEPTVTASTTMTTSVTATPEPVIPEVKE